MKRLLTTFILALLLLVACGGNPEPAANAPADDNLQAEPETESSAPEDDVAEEAQEEPAPEVAASTEEEPAAEEDTAAAVESDTAEDSNPAGLPVNPDPVVPGEMFIVEGVVVNATMIPADAPQFVIEGDNGVRYRMNSQPAGEIFTSTGEQLLPHQYGPGLRVRATVLLAADATAQDVAVTEDLTIIVEE